MAYNVPAVRELPHAVGSRCGCTEPGTDVLSACGVSCHPRKVRKSNHHWFSPFLAFSSFPIVHAGREADNDFGLLWNVLER